jgi:hypothetical protein
MYKPIYSSSWAVLIGINHYQDPQIRDLRGPVSDAEDFAEVLMTIYDFPEDQVIVLVDDEATKDAILYALEQVTDNTVDPDDRVLIFFSGHGIVRKGRKKTYYLVPADAQIGDWNSFVSQDDFLVRCRHIPAKHVLYVIDACHSGAFVLEPKQIVPDVEEMLRCSAWQAVGASLPDQVALDAGPERHSLFTEHLLRGLRGEAARPDDGILTFTHLALFARDSVSRVNKKQIPIFGYLPDSDPGEFVFHFESKNSISPEISKALASELDGVRLAAIWELEAQSVSDDPDIGYRSRMTLKEIAINSESKLLSMAARVATELSIPMLEAIRKDWAKGPLFDPSDSSIFDRLVAAIEYRGRNDFYMNNDAVHLVRRFGLDQWDEVSQGQKRRFARAIVTSAMHGAFESQRFLTHSAGVPDPWLDEIIDEQAIYLIGKSAPWWNTGILHAAHSPLRVRVRQQGRLPNLWFLLLESSLAGVTDDWYNMRSEKLRTAFHEIWQEIKNDLERWPSHSDLVTRLLFAAGWDQRKAVGEVL